MIGATLEILFGDAPGTLTGLMVLHRLYPETAKLSEEDQYGHELLKGSAIEYLQFEVSKLEAHRDSQDAGAGRRILKALGGL